MEMISAWLAIRCLQKTDFEVSFLPKNVFLIIIDSVIIDYLSSLVIPLQSELRLSLLCLLTLENRLCRIKYVTFGHIHMFLQSCHLGLYWRRDSI